MVRSNSVQIFRINTVVDVQNVTDIEMDICKIQG